MHVCTATLLLTCPNVWAGPPGPPGEVNILLGAGDVRWVCEVHSESSEFLAHLARCQRWPLRLLSLTWQTRWICFMAVNCLSIFWIVGSLATLAESEAWYVVVFIHSFIHLSLGSVTATAHPTPQFKHVQ